MLEMDDVQLLGAEYRARLTAAKKHTEASIPDALVFGLAQCLHDGRGHILCQHQGRSTRAIFSVISQACVALFGLEYVQYTCTPQTTYADIVNLIVPRDVPEDVVVPDVANDDAANVSSVSNLDSVIADTQLPATSQTTYANVSSPGPARISSRSTHSKQPARASSPQPPRQVQMLKHSTSLNRSQSLRGSMDMVTASATVPSLSNKHIRSFSSFPALGTPESTSNSHPGKRGGRMANVLILDGLHRVPTQVQFSIAEMLLQRVAVRRGDGKDHAYHLPDHFVLVAVTSLAPAALCTMLMSQMLVCVPLPWVPPVRTAQRSDDADLFLESGHVSKLREATRLVFCPGDVDAYVKRIVSAIRNHSHTRGGLHSAVIPSFIRGLRLHSVLLGRSYIHPQQIRQIAPYFLLHHIETTDPETSQQAWLRREAELAELNSRVGSTARRDSMGTGMAEGPQGEIEEIRLRLQHEHQARSEELTRRRQTILADVLNAANTPH